MADGGQQPGHAGRGVRGVDGYEQALVLGLGEVLEGGRGREALAGEVAGVDVEADVADVDGRQGRGVGDDVALGALGQGDGGGGVDDALVEGAGGVGVVDAEDGVAQGGVLGQDELVDQGAGVPGGGDLEGVAGLGGEGLLEVLRDVEGVVGDDGDGLGVGLGAGLLALAAGGQAQADGAGGGSGEQGAAAEGRVGPAGAVGGLDAHVCLLDGSPEGPATTCGAPGRWSRLPSPVLTGAGSRVCGLPHSQRRRRRPAGQWRPGRRRGAPLSLQVNCSSTAPADTNSVRPAPRARALPHTRALPRHRVFAFPRHRLSVRS